MLSIFKWFNCLEFNSMVYYFDVKINEIYWSKHRIQLTYCVTLPHTFPGPIPSWWDLLKMQNIVIEYANDIYETYKKLFFNDQIHYFSKAYIFENYIQHYYNHVYYWSQTLLLFLIYHSGEWISKDKYKKITEHWFSPGNDTGIEGVLKPDYSETHWSLTPLEVYLMKSSWACKTKWWSSHSSR